MLLLSSVGGVVAGGILGGMSSELTDVPGLLVMVPAFLAIRGSVYGSLGSRLSSALHQGLIEPVITYDERLVRSILAALLNGVGASFTAAVLTYALLTMLDITVAPIWRLVWIAVLGGAMAGIALTVVIVTVVYMGFRGGLDPDNIVGPAVTTAGDIFGMGALFLATKFVLGLS